MLKPQNCWGMKKQVIRLGMSIRKKLAYVGILQVYIVWIIVTFWLKVTSLWKCFWTSDQVKIKVVTINIIRNSQLLNIRRSPNWSILFYYRKLFSKIIPICFTNINKKIKIIKLTVEAYILLPQETAALLLCYIIKNEIVVN
jgi:hypothetical protein